MNIKVFASIFILLTLGFSALSNASGFHNYYNNFRAVEILNEQQLHQFVMANNFHGKGTSQDPYILSFNAYNLVLRNVSSYVILLNCHFTTGYINFANVENLKIENTLLYGETSFINTHNIILSNVSIGYSYFLFKNSSNIKIENSTSTIQIHFNNIKNLYLHNVKSKGYYTAISLENVKNTYINSTSASYLDIEDSENIQIAKANITLRGDFSIINSKEIIVKNSTIPKGYFGNVSNLTIDNLNVYWYMEISGVKGISERIRIQNSTAKILIMKNVKNVELQNMKLVKDGDESMWNIDSGIYLDGGKGVILENILISGIYKEGFYINNTNNIKIENSKIAINYPVEIRDRYGDIIGHKHIAVGLILNSSKYVTVRNSTFNKSQSIGIKIVNSEHITIKNNRFSYAISTPIKIDGKTRFLLIQGNSRSSINHPLGLEIFIIILLILSIFLLGKYKPKMKEENYSKRKLDYEIESIREKL